MTIASLIWFVVYALGAGAIVGLLWYGLTYVESQFPGFDVFWKVVRCAFVVLVIVVLCFVILAFMGQPVVRWQ